MNQRELVPCPSCHRHVFVGSCACPFCAAALTEACASKAELPGWRGRLKRAARMAAAASLLGASSCSTTVEYGVSMGGGIDAGGDAADWGPDGADGDAGAATDAADGGPDRTDR